MNSYLKTIFLLGILSVILITLGRIFAGPTGMYIALILALIINGISYFYSDKIALMMSNAQPLDKKDAPELYGLIAELAKKMNLPMPQLYITPAQQANAFATGRDPHHASVAVTQGIMHLLSRNELEAVLAHELGHVKNRDILIASVAAVLASAISWIANMALWSGGGRDDEGNSNALFALLAALVVPIAASLIQLAISRQREFNADETGAKTMHTGTYLADALLKISGSTKRAPEQVNPAVSSLYIANPLGGLGRGLMQLFSTHPPIEERVERLRKMK